MKFVPQSIPEVLLIEPDILGDERGNFSETYRKDMLEKETGYEVNFCQDNESKSTRGIIRGLHYQLPPYSQAKLVRVIEGRVLEINDVIARANVIDVTKIENNGKIIFGSTVEVKDLENNKNKSFKIVGKDEANIEKSLIYFKSPMGKSLIGKSIKDLIIVKTPSGDKNFEILKVEYI